MLADAGHMDTIANRCPSAVKALLDACDGHSIFPHHSLAAQDHIENVWRHRQAEKADSQRASNILVAQTLYAAAIAQPTPPQSTLPPVAAARPPPSTDLITLTAEANQLLAASASNPADTALAARALEAAKALTSALEHQQAGEAGRPSVGN